MAKAKIKGPQRMGASAMDEGDLTRAVVASYSGLTQDEAREAGQDAAALVLPARRRLWSLAEKLVPQRLAAALRARCGSDDATAREGVRELRMALADWLDPPPVCRWCRAPIRQGDEGRPCPRRSVRLVANRRRVQVERLASHSAPLLLGDAALGLQVGQDAYHGDPVNGSVPSVVVGRKRRGAPSHALKGGHLLKHRDGVVHGLNPSTSAPAALVCRPAKTKPIGAVARCGTLAFPAGVVSLEVMAATLRVPKGAAKGYDVACDRDARALTVATSDGPPTGRDLGDEEAWQNDTIRRMYAALAELPCAGTPPPKQIVMARKAWRKAREDAVRANGRAFLGVQTNHASPNGGICRADLVQGAAMGTDRALADYDASQSRFTTYGAEWMRQGCCDALDDRDLVGTPEWVHALRIKVEDRLPGHTRAEVLRCVEALADATHASSPAKTRAKATALAEDLARLVILGAEVRENVLGSRPARYIRHPMFADQSDDAIASHAASLLRKAKDGGKVKKAKAGKPGKSTTNAAATTDPLADAEDPERIRERIGDWLGKRLRLAKASGAGVLAALRHGAPVIVQVGAGGDDEDDAQGTDGAGGLERQAAVLAAPDEETARMEEDLAAKRWQAALGALAALRSSGGKEAAEVVRRHHGLDGIAEDSRNGTGESFQSIGQTGLACSGRRLNKEAVRKIYQRGIQVMQDYIAGRGIAADLLADVVDDGEDYSAPIVPRSPFKPLSAPARPATPPAPTVPVLVTPAAPSPAWDAWREQVDGVRW